MAYSLGIKKASMWSIRNIFYQSYRLKNRPELNHWFISSLFPKFSWYWCLCCKLLKMP
jgi:hypothetical protein